VSDTADTLHRPTEPAPRSRGQRFWRALDERLGLSGLQYPIPEHANELAYSLGGLSLICFVLLVATGIFLTQYYNPDPAAAHESVRHIITGVSGGDFLRAFHYWAAMAMIVLVGLHLLRVFVSAAYKRPREGNWVVGVALAALTPGCSSPAAC
jgi:ubiquinol-cytochrome c reductase cytochrome b subunit